MDQPPAADPQRNQPSPAYSVASQAAARAQPSTAGAVAPSAPAGQQPLANNPLIPPLVQAALAPVTLPPPLVGAHVTRAQAGAATNPRAAQQVAQSANAQPQPIRFALQRPNPAIIPFRRAPYDVQIILARSGGPHRFFPDGPAYAIYFPVLADGNYASPAWRWPVQALAGRRVPPARNLAGNGPESLRYLSAQALANSLFLPDGRVCQVQVPYMLFKNQNDFRVANDRNWQRH